METLWKIYRESREDDCAFRKHQCRTIQQEHHKWQHNQYHSHSVKNNWISFVDIVKCIGVSIITNPRATLKWIDTTYSGKQMGCFSLGYCDANSQRVLLLDLTKKTPAVPTLNQEKSILIIILYLRVFFSLFLFSMITWLRWMFG